MQRIARLLLAVGWVAMWPTADIPVAAITPVPTRVPPTPLVTPAATPGQSDLPAFATQFPTAQTDGPVGMTILIVVIGVLLLSALLAFLLARRRRRTAQDGGAR